MMQVCMQGYLVFITVCPVYILVCCILFDRLLFKMDLGIHRHSDYILVISLNIFI